MAEDLISLRREVVRAAIDAFESLWTLRPGTNLMPADICSPALLNKIQDVHRALRASIALPPSLPPTEREPLTKFTSLIGWLRVQALQWEASGLPETNEDLMAVRKWAHELSALTVEPAPELPLNCPMQSRSYCALFSTEKERAWVKRAAEDEEKYGDFLPIGALYAPEPAPKPEIEQPNSVYSASALRQPDQGAPVQTAASDWRLAAAAFLRGEAEDQQRTNEQYPRHVAVYPLWKSRVNWAVNLAEKLEHLSAASPFGLDCDVSQPSGELDQGAVGHMLKSWTMLLTTAKQAESLIPHLTDPDSNDPAAKVLRDLRSAISSAAAPTTGSAAPDGMDE